MRDITMLHEILKKHCPNVHQKRLNSLMCATQSLLDGQQLSLTELGRNIRGRVSAKHNIKRMDRLLGNASLHNERLDIYRWHARYLCGANPMPIVLVDWSDVREQTRLMTLRASVSVKGRSVILYERVFPFSQYNSPISHKVFLRELADILPPRCCPLIVTDAGYRNPWFREVERYGWYWLGRVRGQVGFRKRTSEVWESTKSYHEQASHKATFLGEGELGRKRPIDAYLHLYKAKAKGRKDRRSTRSGGYHGSEGAYREGSKEPWLLATNMPGVLMTSSQVVSMYAKRMQIEESFRDVKSPQYGLGIRHSASSNEKRFNILLLIAMLAEWVFRLIGLIARKHNWQRYFQANTTRHRPVLSIIRLGREVRKRSKEYPLNEKEIQWAIEHYIQWVHIEGMPKL